MMQYTQFIYGYDTHSYAKTIKLGENAVIEGTHSCYDLSSCAGRYIGSNSSASPIHIGVSALHRERVSWCCIGCQVHTKSHFKLPIQQAARVMCPHKPVVSSLL